MKHLVLHQEVTTVVTLYLVVLHQPEVAVVDPTQIMLLDLVPMVALVAEVPKVVIQHRVDQELLIKDMTAVTETMPQPEAVVEQVPSEQMEELVQAA